MKGSAHFLRRTIMLFALLAYSLLPAVSFSYQGVSLYVMAGITAGTEFHWFYFLPIGLMLLSLLASGRGALVLGGLSVVSLASTLALRFFPSFFDGANAPWLFSNATALFAALSEQVQGSPAQLLFYGVSARMISAAYGLWIALALMLLGMLGTPED